MTTLFSRVSTPRTYSTCEGSDEAKLLSGQVFGPSTKLAIGLIYDILSQKNAMKRMSEPHCYFIQSDFKYIQFEANMLWYLGMLVDTEDKLWDPKQRGLSTSTKAYGYFQVINKSVLVDAMKSFVNRMEQVRKNQINPAGPTWLAQSPLLTDVPAYPTWYKGLKIDLADPGLDHYAIIDKWPADVIACILLSQMYGRAKDCDFMGIYDGSVDGAKLVYYRGHHSSVVYKPMTRGALLAGQFPKGIAPSVLAELQSTHTNVDKNFKCYKRSTISYKIGSNIGVPANIACQVDFTKADVDAVVDHIFSTVNLRSGEDYANTMRDNGFIIDDVTDHLTPDPKNLLYSAIYTDPGVVIDKIIRIYSPAATYTQYVSIAQDFDAAVRIVKGKIRRDIKNNTNPIELLQSVKEAFTGYHDLYLLGSLIFHEEPWALATIFMDQGDVDKYVKHMEPVTIGGVELFPIQFTPKGDNVNQVNLLFYPYRAQQMGDNFDGTMIASDTVVDLAVQKVDFVRFIEYWKTQKTLLKINETKGDEFLYEYIDQGKVKTGTTLGSWMSTKDETTMSLMTPDMLQTLLHEIGAHRHHKSSWGKTDLFTLDEIEEIRTATESVTFEATKAKLYELYEVAANAVPHVIDDQNNAANAYLNYIKATTHPIIKNLANVNNEIYDKKGEDEMLARIYGMMAANKCVTFGNDIYPALNAIGIELTVDLVTELDRVMEEEMKLDMRVYANFTSTEEVAKRDRLKAHLRAFIENNINKDSLLLEAFLRVAAGTVVHDAPEAALANFIEISVNALPEDAYVLDYPEFYLPINTNMPQIILASSIGDGDGTMTAYYATILGRDVLAIDISDDPTLCLAKLIHEYGHHLVYNGDMGIPNNNYGRLVYLLKDYANFTWEEWSLVTTDMYSANLRAYGKIADADYLNPLGSITRENYGTDSELINETLVRIRANVAMESKYASIDDIFESDKHTVIFTNMFLSIISAFSWP